MLISVAAVAAIATAGQTSFVDRVTVRRHFRFAAAAGPGSPWPDPLDLRGVKQLVARPTDGSAAWAVEPLGALWLLDGGADGGQGMAPKRVVASGHPIDVASGGRIASVGAATAGGGDVLVLAEPARLTWLSCRAGAATCEAQGEGSGPGSEVFDLFVARSDGVTAAAAGAVWLGTARGLARSDGVGRPATPVDNVTDRPVVAVAVSGPYVAAATIDTLHWRDVTSSNTRWAHIGVGGVIDPFITSLRFAPDGWASGGGARTGPLTAMNAPGGSRPPLVVGTSHAVHVLEPSGVVARLSSLQGLPVGHATALAAGAGPNASVWVATPDGLVEMLSSAAEPWRYYSSDRWLPTNATTQRSLVAAVAVGSVPASPVGNGGAAPGVKQAGATVVWAATDVGVAAIRLVPTTLEEKASHYQAMVSPRHDRYGWTAQVPLSRYGVADSAVPTDGDNDGSNTGYYLASQIFRHRVTGDPDALASSWRAFAAVEFLHNVTRPFSSRPGFVARTAVRCGEPHQGPSGGVCSKGCKCPGPVNASCPGCSPPPGSCTGCACPGWRNSSECYHGVDPLGSERCCWSFKADTSTDETDGHFYVLHLAYDELAATEAERVRVARLICNLASYIVDGGYVYMDPLTGNRTTWGYWAPSILNAVGMGGSNGVGNFGKPNERGLNSLEVLSYLSVANKICGAHPGATPPLRHPANKTYGDAVAELLDSGFGENILNVHLTNPGWANQGIAWFDFGNSFYTYYSMHRAAPWNATWSTPSLTKARLATLRDQFYTGFEAYWAARSFNARDERDGLWSVIYTAVTGRPGIADPMWVLRRGPRELVQWPVNNTRRLDVALQKDWLACCGSRVATRALPPDESPDARWEDDSPYPLAGGSGMFESPPTLYLEAYWMARFHGVVGADGTDA